MDTTKTALYVGITALLTLLIVSPVAAQSPPPSDELHINSAGIMSGQLPAPLPESPPGVDMPDLLLPNPDSSSWPSSVAAQESVRGEVEDYVGEFNGALGNQYAWVLDRVHSARVLTNQMRQVVGTASNNESSEPRMNTFGIQSGAQQVTATSIATDLAGAIRFSMAYLRSISDLGPLGLDLVFVFVGLGWIVLVNVADFAVRISAWLLGTIIRVIGFILNTVVQIILGIINIILKIIGIILPF